MKYELDVDTHNGVGPLHDIYDHGPVTVIQQYDGDPESPSSSYAGAVYVCLDCGYTAHDRRLFLDPDCDREDNPINQTWREYAGDTIDE